MPERRILILGATENQIPVVYEVERRGYISVVADNKPRNPAHRIASESHVTSTTDVEALLRLARNLDVVGVIAHGSDPAAFSAAVVTNELGLPGDDVEAVTRVQNKSTLRELQQNLGLSVPTWTVPQSREDLRGFLQRFPSGIIVKPVDGSGSRGVSRVARGASAETISHAFDYSSTESRSGRVIAEELLPHSGVQLGGDVVFAEGLIKQVFFTTQFMANSGVGLAVAANLIPTTFDSRFTEAAVAQLDRVIQGAGLRQGIYNFEFMSGPGGSPVLIDFGARSGGGLYGELFARAYGIDPVSLNVDLSLGIPLNFSPKQTPEMPVLGITLHSLESGHFKGVRFSRSLKGVIVKELVSSQPGDWVSRFSHSGERVGMVIASSKDHGILADIARNIYDHFKAEVETA